MTILNGYCGWKTNIAKIQARARKAMKKERKISRAKNKLKKQIIKRVYSKMKQGFQ